MKILNHIVGPHDCQAKLRAFGDAQETPFWLGSIVECDCGRRYKVADDQREGPHWEWHHPDSGDMAKR